VVSPLAYMALMIGLALAMLKMWSGGIIFVIGIALSLIMYWVIDPKLKAISEEYEKKQKQYLEHLEKIVRWEGVR
jgi:ABC-type transport system involved in cytochrome bd biosynthesis fused ATPase/permease subunit